MPQISWPQRVINCSQIAAISGGHTFSVPISERQHIEVLSEVDIDASDFSGTSKSTVYVHRVKDQIGFYQLSETETGTAFIQNLPGVFQIRQDITIITNYPVRPHLKDPGAVVNTSTYNPRSHTTFTQGEPRYEGSVQVSVADGEDVRVFEAFIDQLANPDNWFELPLPEPFLPADEVSNFDDGDLTIEGGYNDYNLVGRYVRAGVRCARVISHRIGSNGKHIIKIYPSLVNEPSTTAFSNTHSVRVRATGVSPSGSTDYGADWTIDWEETRGVQ